VSELAIDARARSTIAGVLLLVAAGVGVALGWDRGAGVLAIVATLVAGVPVARAGWRAVRLRVLDMNALMTIAAAGGMATGESLEAATAVCLFGVSLWLERYSLGRTRHAVGTLAALAPQVAHCQVGETLVNKHPDELVVGDVVLVRPGERIPIDGQVVNGASSVNEAPITGESMPVDKASGMRVFAGSLNGEGSLTLEVAAPAAESTLAGIQRLVDEAHADRSPTSRFIDRFASWYTPVVIVLALLAAIVPTALGYDGWVHRALVLLVIACPCALVIATPVTIVCGLYHAARRGILIKGGEHLEAAAAIRCLAIDKTGTLTRGELDVVDVLVRETDSGTVSTQYDVLRIAAALERHSEHPLAKAIRRATDLAADRNSAVAVAVERFEARRGFGVRGDIDGVTHLVGNAALFESSAQLGENDGRFIGQMSGQSDRVCVFVGTTKRLLGVILLEDELRPEASDVVVDLKTLGVDPIVVLTGDRAELATSLGDALGLDDVRADLLPAEKLDAVRELARTHESMAMIGDGVNDAPALAAVRLGIAFGGAASATAIESADVVIIAPSLRRVAELLRLGRRCRRLLWQNIVAALAIKAVVLALAIMGVATMWMAVAADVGASLLVISNGMRLLRAKDRGA
jgi:Cd2+/Zn2+-exporting ATPase